MTTLRIASSAFIYTPNFFRWIESAIMPFDNEQAAKMLDAIGIRSDLIQPILAGSYKAKAEGDVLILEIEEA
jgi:hypothetical protein